MSINIYHEISEDEWQSIPMLYQHQSDYPDAYIAQWRITRLKPILQQLNSAVEFKYFYKLFVMRLGLQWSQRAHMKHGLEIAFSQRALELLDVV